MGRSSVREAYRVLELLGIVQVRKGNDGGPFIVEPSNASASETITDLMRWHNVDLATLAEGRRFIERGTAELAGQRASQEDLSTLEEILDRAAERVARAEPVADLGIEFHLTLARVARNPLLLMALTSIMELMRRVLRKITPNAETTRQELLEHRQLLEALKAHQAERAGWLMDRHLRHSQRRLEALAERPEGVQTVPPAATPGT